MKKKKTHKLDSSLKASLQPKIRQEYLDYDYLDQLSKEEYDWLAAFTHEDNCANLNHPGPKILKRNKKARSEIYKKNNKRNNDTFGISHAHRRLMYLEGGAPDFLDDYDVDQRNPEDSMIELIDNKNSEYKLDQLEIEFKRAKKYVEKQTKKASKKRKNKRKQ
jgi:hypothetical protein